VVSKAFSDALFLLLSTSGDRFLASDTNERLQDYVTSKDWLQIDVKFG
jgi:hypothetical protein